jgi:uncharacterized FAD-dependent dehydrogenase
MSKSANRLTADQEYLYRGLRRSVSDREPLRLALARELDLPEIESVTIEREAIDARRRHAVVYVYNLRFRVSQVTPRLRQLVARGEIQPYRPEQPHQPEPRLALPERPVVVGFGPAGMFVGLALAEKGYRPVIYDRGDAVADRIERVEYLWQAGELDPESNMQFGEGGAGTFSDGKLTTGKQRPLNDQVLQTFARAGAPDRILYQSKPHIGTDHLRRVVTNLRQEIVSLGGEVHFRQRLTDLELGPAGIRRAVVDGRPVETSCLILAIGHSSRDTFEMLHRRGAAMEPKPFAVGVRIEHPAAFIDEAQYGAEAAALLPAADYKLTYRYKGLGVYTFCMCPGGYVVCAASERGGLVTNGMSYFARDGRYSNSAVVVSVDPAAHGFGSPLDALAFQRQFEQRAFQAGGGGYVAPAQRAIDFVRERPSHSPPATSYRPGVRPVDLNAVLPPAVLPALRAGLAHFDRLMPGFVDQGVLIGFESRTSSPLRILRDGNFQSVSIPGLYLLGEGAGYAGGIMTCALDALRFAQLVRPFERLGQG